jgi:thiamine-monophosphate kinase
MKEYDFIKYISEKRRLSPAQINKAFEADAEIVKLNDSLWAITVDEFSAEEDFFIHADPHVIGWNLAVATMSDLFACGVKPKFFMQTILRAHEDSDIFYKKLMDGIFEALNACECFLLGGDVGSAAKWRYSGIAFGEVKNKAITRVIEHKEDLDIWITGTCGDSNLAILQGSNIPRFELRINEVYTINKFASACTDTSGGFCDAVWNLKKVNPGFDFKINLDMFPFDSTLLKLRYKYDLYPELSLIGGAGEYELLLLAPKNRADEFKKNPAFTKIGSVCSDSAKAGVRFFKNNTQTGEMLQPPPCYRSCNEADYLKITNEYYEHNFNQRKK